MQTAVMDEYGVPAALSIVVASLIVLIGICAVAAITLAVLHFNDSLMVRTDAPPGASERMKTEAARTAPTGSLPYNASLITLRPKRGGGSSTAVGDSSAKSGKLHHRRNSGCSLAGSNIDHLEASSMYDTQETLGSAMVREILGSVDDNHIRETQVLLSSFNWDLEELLHEELLQGKPV